MIESLEPVDRYRYRFGGLVIGSPVQIGFLPSVNCESPVSDDPSIVFRFSDRPLFTDGDFVYVWKGRHDLSLYKTSGDWVFRYATGIEFGTDPTGSVITCFTGSDGWSQASAELLVRRILPRIVTLRGRNVTHAASLTTPYGGVLLCGYSHAGKSTLSASLAQNLGWGLLDDDTSILTEHSGEDQSHFKVHSASAHASLWSDSQEALSADMVNLAPMSVAEGKYRCQLPNKNGIEDQRLAVIYRLDSYIPDNPSEGDIRTGVLRPQDATMLLVRHQVRLNPTDAEAEAKRLACLGRIMARVPIRTLTYPKVYDRLPEVCERVREDLMTLSRSSQ